MSDDTNRPEKRSDSGLDLSGLNELSLGPNWGSGSLPSSQTPRTRSRERESYPERRSGDGSRPGPRRDRRGDLPKRSRDEGGAPPRGRDDGPGQEGREGRRGRFQRGGRDRDRDRGDRGGRPEAPFKPILQADFYPDDAPFKALTQAIKNSCRTFELFEIAQLILQKPERWVCVAKHPEQKDGEPALLHACVHDGLPFLSEQAAIDHAFNHYLSDFYIVEEYEGEAPAGSFPMIHRCGMTGELLAPPNYHRYQAILREHHASRLAHVAYERFEQKLEAVREPEAISAWQEKMKKRVRYILKPEFAEGSPVKSFENREDARIFLLTHHRDKLVRPAYSVRFVGKDLTLLPESDLLRRSVEALHLYQQRFPLDTANNLRGRLRRLNFAVYKKGSKGVSFVCAVKRHFRTPSEVLAENLADLIAFVEAHPNTKASDLPKEYLGISDSPEPESSQAASDGGDGEDSDKAAAATPKSAAKPSPDQEPILALRRDLRYLVTQGYIIEYSDGRLYVPPMRDASGQIIDPSDAEDEPAEASAPAATTEREEAPASAAAAAPQAETPPEKAPESVVEAEAAVVEETAEAKPAEEPSSAEPEAEEEKAPETEASTEGPTSEQPSEESKTEPMGEDSPPAEANPAESAVAEPEEPASPEAPQTPPPGNEAEAETEEDSKAEKE